jgi:hypothetical protein
VTDQIYHVALPFLVTKDGTMEPGESVECPSADTAMMSAEILSRIEGNISAIAFSRTIDPATGLFADAVVLKTFGHVPDDLTMLF